MFKNYIEAVSDIENNDQFNIYKRLFHQSSKLIILGNGGSNAVASHICEDACKMFNKRALSFSDPSMLTCFINDFGMNNAYVEFLKRFADIDTLVILISSSGESKNIINSIKYCEKNNFKYGILTGFKKNNKARKISSNSAFDFHVNSNNYGVIECTHQIFLHGTI